MFIMFNLSPLEAAFPQFGFLFSNSVAYNDFAVSSAVNFDGLIP